MSQRHLWFTADTHFGADSFDILTREMRPFNTANEYMHEQVKIWNSQIQKDDVIYAIGDFINYNYSSNENDFDSGLSVSRMVNSHIVLIIGNSEERVIDDHFDGSLEKFKEYCINEYNFDDVKLNDYVELCGQKFFLTHRPKDHDKHCQTLFGHIHRGGGLYRPYGFNVGTDLYNYRLVDENVIKDLLERKLWWDDDIDINCYK